MHWLDGYCPRNVRVVVFHAGRGSGGLGDRLGSGNGRSHTTSFAAWQPSSHGRMLPER